MTSAQRKRFNLEKIDTEAMEQDPGMRGMLSFLETPPEEKARLIELRDRMERQRLAGSPAPPLQQIENKPVSITSPDDNPFPDAASPAMPSEDPGAPDLRSSAPKLDAPELSASDLGASELSASDLANTVSLYSYASSGAPELDAPELRSSAPNSGASELGAPELSASDLQVDRYLYRRLQSRDLVEARTAQDGHTHGEQALYSTLWRLARPTGAGRTKALKIGERTLAKEVPMAYSNIRDNLRSLQQKLAIHIQPGDPNKPKLYTVFSYEEILQRRREAGLTHIQRRTSGVTLVRSDAPSSGAPELRSDAPSLGALELRSGAPRLGNPGAPSLAAPIRNKSFQVEEGASSSPSEVDLGVLIQALRRHVPDVDDDAASRLLEACSVQAPDATIEEIVHFVNLKAGKSGIRLPMGFLLVSVPKCFTGESFRQFRADRDRAKNRQKKDALDRNRRFAEEILRSPDADDEQREWARAVLSSQQDGEKR